MSQELVLRLLIQEAATTLEQCLNAIEAQSAIIESLEQENKRKDEAMLRVIHDLRGQLSSFAIVPELLARAIADNDSDRIQKYLAVLTSGLRELIHTSNQVIELGLLTANAVQTELGWLDLDVWLPQVLDGFKTRALATRRIEVKIVLPILGSIYTDVRLLLEVLKELFTNALKYSDGEIAILCLKWEEQVKIGIANTGEIPEAEIPFIWDKFFRSKRSMSEPGNGLGLAYVREAVKILKGNVSVQATHGWTEFAVWLPRSASY